MNLKLLALFIAGVVLGLVFGSTIAASSQSIDPKAPPPPPPAPSELLRLECLNLCTPANVVRLDLLQGRLNSVLTIDDLPDFPVKVSLGKKRVPKLKFRRIRPIPPQ